MRKNKIFCFIVLVFLFLTIRCFSQNYDLIVNVNGDSIACQIDSITKDCIYFEMKSMNHWSHTFINQTDVRSYEKDAIKKGHFQYMNGTSIIKAVKPQIPNNSVYAGIGTINYSRTFTRNTFWMTLGGGLIFLDETGIIIESTTFFGSIKNFFEVGINGFCFISLEDGGIARDEESPTNRKEIGGCIRFGYRYQGTKGLLIRAAPQICFFESDVFFLPALSLGYSF